ncbi:MAG: hypothetical protein HFJ80_04115 [Clostridiales bacterium]|nr:hypothetical protein [Clostridiales bacterium]
MEAMIRRIIEMDQKARQITDAAEQEKTDSEKEIAERAAQLRDTYLKQARERISKNAETERRLADEEWGRREAYYTGQSSRLEQLIQSKREEWIQQIVEHVTA